MSNVTAILTQIRNGDTRTPEQLAKSLYGQLRRMAAHQMASERPDHTLQPTALVHEAYLRLVGSDGATFENRAHFLGAAAVAIRRVLVEHARRRARLKRGGNLARVDLADMDPSAPVSDASLLDLDEALSRLSEFASDQARLVELRFFGGMTMPEIGTFTGVSQSTLQRQWRTARAWLKGELEDPGGR